MPERSDLDNCDLTPHHRRVKNNKAQLLCEEVKTKADEPLNVNYEDNSTKRPSKKGL